MAANDPDEIVTGYEASIEPDLRRASGSYFTPPGIASGLARLALEGMARRSTVCDPACGAGAMLLAAGRLLASRGVPVADVARHLLWGIDLDAAAVAAARQAIVAWAGVDPGDHLVVGDGLRAGERWAKRFDAVLGNPPFLNQLARATVRTQEVPEHLRPYVRPYTDTAWLFLAAAPGLVRDGGRVVLIQPQSVAAARDAGPVRAHIGAVAALEAMWSSAGPVFEASVRVCAPVLRVGARPADAVARWSGVDFAPESPRGRPTHTWSALLVQPDAAPGVLFDRSTGTLGALVTATAGFRQQFYGLAPYVVDDADGDDATHAPLVTTAHLHVGRIGWGDRPVRFARRRLAHPRVDLAALERGGPVSLARWVASRRTPKVLLATQTRVLEAGVDVAGVAIPSTPVIAIEGADDPWLVAAVLTAPPVSAWALACHGGTALSPGAIKLAARQVLDVPLPADHTLWELGACRLRDGDVAGAAQALNAAYGTPDTVLDWWSHRARLPISTQ
ncbi:MAG: N-6 DNA methylase [Acidimicrobiales bacterium]